MDGVEKMFEIIKKDQYKVSTWSGGTTTEIFLAPQDGSYAERRFDFRISSATVDLEESDFTPLDGVKRFLTILEGQMDLTFREKTDRKVTLNPYEVVEFMGDVPTHSVGKAKDFNLMLKGCEGVMETFCGGFCVEIPAGVEVFVYSVQPWKGILGEEEIAVDAEDTLHIYSLSECISLQASANGNTDGVNWVVLMVQA